MAEKVLNTRIVIKNDTLEAFNKSTFIPKKGELLLAQVDVWQIDSVTQEKVLVPTYLMKVGDGVHVFSQLNWVAAQAADVHAWAKKSEEDFTTWVKGLIDVSDIDAYSKTEADNLLAGKVDNSAFDTYKTTNDAAVKKVADDLAAEAEAARAAEKANADAISAIKDHESVDSFADVMAEIAKKQDTIPENTYDAYGAAAQALTDAKAHTNELANGAVKANTDAIAAIKDGTEIDSFKDVEESINAIGEAVESMDLSGIKTNADAIAAIKNGAKIDSFKDVEDELAGFTEGLSHVMGIGEDGSFEFETDAFGVIPAINEINANADANAADIDKLEASLAEGGATANAIADAKRAGTDAMAEAKAKVASVTAADASVTVAGTATAPTVAVKLDPSADNALKLNENGLKVEIGAAPEYSIVKAADSGEFAAVYNLTKDGTIVGASINIPKDIVVKSGSVVGDEIVLVLNDEESTEIKIPVASLIEYVTSGSATGDMVVVNVSDDHKVTATITDGTITLAKLTTEVQTAIGKAHVHENADVINAITADDVENWNGAQAAAEATAAGALAAAKSELEGKITAAQTAAEGHADDLNTAMNTRVGALETKVDTGDQKVSEYVAAAIEDAKTDASNKDAVVLAEAQKGIATAQATLEAAIATKANDADLKAVAKSGLIDDLSIGEGTVLVFDCGNASV